MFSKLTLKTKLLAFPLLAALCMLLVLGLVHGLLRQNRADIHLAMEAHVPALEDCRNLEESLRLADLRWRQALLSGDPANVWALSRQRDRFLADVETARSRGIWREGQLDSLAGAFIRGYDRLQRTTLEAMGSHRMGQNMTLLRSEPFEAIRLVVERIEAEQVEAVHWAFASAETAQRNMIQIIGITALILAAGFAGISNRIRHSIVHSLQQLLEVAQCVAQGDLTVCVPSSHNGDDIGTLMQAFNGMVGNLRALTGQVKGGAQALAASAEQISASVAEIASAATQTATAASETSTTLEEVRQTALDSNRKAKDVSALAQNTVQVSRDGEAAVHEAIDGMRHIEDQMRFIAESMSRLNDQSLAIGEILQTVEDVAEQSRLLAVNASIEAIKAGEHGKGFAVVAQEVRSLAEESKTATTRVRMILDDIQTATGKAMSQTQAGAKAVDAGVTQSTGAGEAIQRLSDAVNTAARATLQISVSSQEQLIGMDQVVGAMQSINLASSQNVTATKQVESAARDLKALGLQLTETLEKYRL